MGDKCQDKLEEKGINEGKNVRASEIREKGGKSAMTSLENKDTWGKEVPNTKEQQNKRSGTITTVPNGTQQRATTHSSNQEEDWS